MSARFNDVAASADSLAVGETMAMVAPFAGGRLACADQFRLDAGGAESNVAAHVAALAHRTACSAASATIRSVIGLRAGSAASRLGPADVDAVPLHGVRFLHVSGITAALSSSAAAFLDGLIDRATTRTCW
jgi:2-dehydro-3-deoxygluconokinase